MECRAAITTICIVFRVTRQVIEPATSHTRDGRSITTPPSRLSMTIRWNLYIVIEDLVITGVHEAKKSVLHVIIKYSTEFRVFLQIR